MRRRFTLILCAAVLIPAAIAARLTVLGGAARLPIDPAAHARVEHEVRAVDQRGYGAMMGAQLELASMGPRAARPLLAHLTHRNPHVRQLATTVLGHVGDWSVVDALVVQLDDADPLVRRMAVLSLLRLGDEAGLQAIRAHANDSSAATRAAIAIALGGGPDAQNLPVLLVLAGDREVVVRQMAAVSLGELGETAAVPALIVCLEDSAVAVRRAAQTSLASLTGQPAHGDPHLWLAWWALRRPA